MDSPRDEDSLLQGLFSQTAIDSYYVVLPLAYTTHIEDFTYHCLNYSSRNCTVLHGTVPR